MNSNSKQKQQPPQYFMLRAKTSKTSATNSSSKTRGTPKPVRQRLDSSCSQSQSKLETENYIDDKERILERIRMFHQSPIQSNHGAKKLVEIFDYLSRKFQQEFMSKIIQNHISNLNDQKFMKLHHQRLMRIVFVALYQNLEQSKILQLQQQKIKIKVDERLKKKYFYKFLYIYTKKLRETERFRTQQTSELNSRRSDDYFVIQEHKRVVSSKSKLSNIINLTTNSSEVDDIEKPVRGSLGSKSSARNQVKNSSSRTQLYKDTNSSSKKSLEKNKIMTFRPSNQKIKSPQRQVLNVQPVEQYVIPQCSIEKNLSVQEFSFNNNEDDPKALEFRSRRLKSITFQYLKRLHLDARSKDLNVLNTREDLLKRQVFFYWYQAITQIKKKKAQIKIGLYNLIQIQDHLFKKRYFMILKYTQEQENTCIQLKPVTLEQNKTQADPLNEILWSKINSWLNDSQYLNYKEGSSKNKSPNIQREIK